jgi:predicted PurR-regulated permease PerM
VVASSRTDGRVSGAAPVRREHRAVPTWLERAAAVAWRLLVVGAAGYFLLVLLARIRVAVLPVIAAVFLSTFLVPVARFLRGRGLPNLAATWGAFLGFLLLIAGLILLIVPSVVSEFDELGPTVRQGADDVREWLVTGPLGLEEAQIEQFTDQATESLRNAQGGVVTGAVLVFEIIAGALLALVLTFFFVKDGEVIQRWALRHVPPDRHAVAKALGRRGWSTVGGYLRGTATLGLIEGTIMGITLLVVGARLALPVALLTFLAAFFPLVGAITAGVIGTLVALVSAGFTEALIVGGVALVVQQFDNDLLAPMVLGKAVRLHPLVILVSLTAGGAIAGIVGAFLAVPVAAVAVALVAEWRQWHDQAEWLPPAADAADALPQSS